MTRAALIAGISVLTLLCAGPSEVSAAWNSDSWWGNTYRMFEPFEPPPRRTFKPRAKPAEGKSKQNESKNDNTPPIPPGLLHVIVSIDKQRATLFADGQPVASTAISSGTHDHPTPMGVFTVIQKDRHHISNLYDASMPYMQRITWSGSALHQGPLPGYPASHGCVRLTESFAQLLWKTTKMGARVIVTRPEVAPLEFAHARLFVPKPKMVAAPPAAVPVPAPAPVVAAEPATTSSVTKVRTAANTTAVTIASVVGDATKAVTTAVVTEPVASTAVEQPTKQSDTYGVGSTRGPTEVKAAEAHSAQAKLVEATVVATKPVETKPAEFQQVEAKPVEARSIPIAVPAPAPNIVDERPKTMPAATVQEANGRPISVFVSLKENKLYVRQGWKPLFDAPVSFEHPEQPIGTHVYTAMSAKAEGGLRWTVVSIPSSFRRAAEAKNADSGRKGRREHAAKAVEIVAPIPNPSPSAALDRIVMPPELVDRIAEMITPGSSLIVSDNKLSDETGEYTDFIVLTR